MNPGPPVSQIALSVADVARSERFYRNAFGLLPAGGTRIRGRIASRVMGLPDVDAQCRWLVGSEALTQLELFEFASPAPAPLSRDRRPCDIGYSRIGLHLRDFDAALHRLQRMGALPLSEPLGPLGARRACVRDPDGVLIELMEDDPASSSAIPPIRPDCPVALRSVTLSTPDLERSVAFFGALGMTDILPEPVHSPAMEALWGMDPATVRREAVALQAGAILVELVQYAAPIGRPRAPSCRLSDVGVLNIALGFGERSAFRRAYRGLLGAGYKTNGPPVDALWYKVVYCVCDQGFSVELLYIHPWFNRFSGFSPRRGSP